MRLITSLLLVLALLLVAVPSAHANVGSTIVSRFWDSFVSTAKNRATSNAPAVVKLVQEAERIFLGGTEDVTTMSAVRDVYAAMRTAGLLLLALCTVFSLAQLTEAGMLGQSGSLIDWFKRFCVATFMTTGAIHVYSFWIRVFNGLLIGFRSYLDTHWTATSDASTLYTQLIGLLDVGNVLLLLLFLLLTLVVLLVLWFLIGGVRTAEMALSVIIAPLVWPLHLIPSLEDIPRQAFRSFLGLNALLLIIVAMLRLSIRMVAGGGLGNTVWNYVPALSLLIMTIFLPAMIKRLIGQGNSGVGALMTVAYVAAGLKGLSMVAGGGAAPGGATRPPATGMVPSVPAGPSSYPVAPVPNAGPSYGSAYRSAPAQVGEGEGMAPPGVLDNPIQYGSGDGCTIDIGESTAGSRNFDTILAIRYFQEGYQSGSQTK